jgi:hypothetical protein
MIRPSFSGQQPERMLSDPKPVLYRKVRRKPIGTVKGVESVPISHQVRGGSGTLAIPGIVEAEMEPYRSPQGSVTTLRGLHLLDGARFAGLGVQGDAAPGQPSPVRDELGVRGPQCYPG